ncbi:hypothetical protein ABKN59_007152 [Abortiporus biennis]
MISFNSNQLQDKRGIQVRSEIALLLGFPRVSILAIMKASGGGCSHPDHRDAASLLKIHPSGRYYFKIMARVFLAQLKHWPWRGARLSLSICSPNFTILTANPHSSDE